MPKALLAIANGTEDMEAVIVADLLRRAGIDVTMAGESTLVTCAYGLKVAPDITIDDIADDEMFDVVILPGGGQGVDAFARNHALESIVRRHHHAEKYIAAICAAPTLLHEWRLLPSEAIVTSYPGFETALDDYTYLTIRVVVDHNIITSRGPGTAIEFALEIIRHLTNEAIESRVASDIVLYE